MNIIPVEIEHYFFSFLSLKDLVQNRLVSNHWLESINIFLKLKRVAYFDDIILASMVKSNSSMLDSMMDRFTVKQKSKICAYYAYYGNKEKINYCLENGAIWNDYCVNYAIYGRNKRLVDIYGSGNIGTEVPYLVLHIDYSDKKMETENDSINNHYQYHISQKIYGDIVSQWLIGSYEKYYQYQNILVMALIENNDEILQELKKCDYQMQESDFIGIIKYGNMEMIKKVFPMFRVCKITSKFLEIIAEYGTLEMLQWFFQLKDQNKIHISIFDLDPDSFITAVAKAGKLEMLEWLFEKKMYESKVPTTTILAALSGNYLDVINYLIDNDHYDPSILTVSTRQNRICNSSQFREIALKCNRETTDFLIKHMPGISLTLSKNMATYGKNIEMFEYLLKEGYDVNVISCSQCAVTGDYLEFMDCMWKYCKDTIQTEWSSLMKDAIYSCRKRMVQWLIQHGMELANLQPFTKYRPTVCNISRICHINKKKLIYFKTNAKIIDLIKSIARV